jgi:hypothetical protein
MGHWDENKLSVIYDKRQKDFVVKYPRRCDGALAIHHIVGDTLVYRHFNEPPYEISNFIKELEERGYDVTTLKFSIKLKKQINENS